MRPRAAVLAIGTELTTGQILNRNASWISKKLDQMGVQVLTHLCVRDDREDIKHAFEILSQKHELVFITGGLGPTRDDFTREVLSTWLNQPLIFNQKSWDKIVQRLTDRGIEVAESNKQQCYFPKIATVLENLEGTADGFTLHAPQPSTAKFYFLPGPPNEGQYIFKEFIDRDIQELFPNLKPSGFQSYLCIGKSESSLGQEVEKIFQPFQNLFEIGYRASPPYVEVKLWYSTERSSEAKIGFQKFEAEFAPWIFSVNEPDIAHSFLQTVEKYFLVNPKTSICIEDPNGTLADRILKAIKDYKMEALFENGPLVLKVGRFSDPISQPNPQTLKLFIKNNKAYVEPLGEMAFEVPYRLPAMAIRAQQFVLEQSLRFFRDQLKTGAKL